MTGVVRPLQGHRPGILAAMAAAAVLPGAFVETVGNHPAVVAPAAHAIVVAFTSAVAAAAAIGLSIAGVRRHDGRTVLLSAAFSTMTALLMVPSGPVPTIFVMSTPFSLARRRALGEIWGDLPSAPVAAAGWPPRSGRGA